LAILEAAQIFQAKALFAGNGQPLARTATQDWEIWGLPFGRTRKTPSALFRPL
jgi:hypothetical protein